MEIVVFFLICILLFSFAVWFIRIPVRIAENRGLSKTQVSFVAVLSWCGILLGVTWTVALILSLVWEADGQDDVSAEKRRGVDPDKLLKLTELREKGILSEKEFDEQKRIMLEK